MPQKCPSCHKNNQNTAIIMLPFHTFGQACLVIQMVDSFIPRDILTKLGMVVGNKMLEDSNTCLLSGGVHKLR
jgi:hypothetical protein